MPDINVEAQGKTFTFPDGTSQQQIGEAVDSFFKGKASSKPSFDYEKGNYIPSEGIGSSGMRSKGTASQQALMTPKAAFSPTSEQRAKLGPLGNGVSQQPLPQGIGYDVARGVLSFMKNEPGATLAKGYYESDPGSYERLLTDKGFMAKAKRTAIGSMEPNQALPLMAGGGILSILPKKAAALGLGAIAANQGREAYHSYQDDDPGGALFDLLLGAAVGLGAKKMYATPEPVGPVPPAYRSPATEAIIRSAEGEVQSTSTRGRRLLPPAYPTSPTARSGKNVRGLLPAAPEGTPQTNVAATEVRPMPGEHPTPYGSEPLTFQQFIDEVQSRNPAKPTAEGEPSRVSGAQPFQLEPNFRPDDTTMSFQDWLDTFQGKGPLSAKQPFTTNQAGVTAKPGESAIQKALPAGEDISREITEPAAPEPPAAPPTKKTGGGLRKKMGGQTGAFDTSIIKDAAEKAVDVASRIGASQIYGEKGMLRPGEMPEAFQNAANSTRDMFIRRGSFTNEIAPDTFRFMNMLDNAPKIARESVDKISRSLDPMTPAMKDTFQDMVTADKQLAVGAKNPIYSDAQVKNFFSNPAIAAILPKYNAAVQRVYGPIRNAAGYGQTNRVGKYSGVYSPSIPEDQLLGASVGGGAPGTKPSLVLNKMPGESQFTGNAPSYLGSLEGAHEFRLSGAVRASLQRQIVKNGVREGVIQSVPDGYDGTMTVKGRNLEAYKFKLSSLFNGGTDLGRIGVADEPSYIMPKQMFDEIRPVFEKGAKPAVDTGKNRSILSKILSPLTLMKAQLLSTGELGAHMVNLPGIAGQATKITTGSKAVDALVNSIPMAKQIVRVKDMVGLTKFSKVDVADARILMAKAGVLKESPLADASSTLQRIIAEKKGAPIPAQTAGNKIAAGLTQPGGVALYARKGFYNNIGTGIVKSMRAQGATDAQIVDALSNLPNKGGTFTSRTQDFVERLLGPGFYSTGVASLKAGLNSMTPRNVAGGLALYTIVGKMLDEDHKAWYERNLLPGQFVRGKDSRGKQMVWDAATFDRPMRVQRDVPGKMYQESQVDLPNETPAHKKARIAETGLWAGVNQLTRPAASGPTMAIGSYATGMLPYLQKSSDRWGPEMAGHPMAKLGPGKADWWKGLGEALLPGAQVAIGDVGAEYRGNSPEDKNLQWVNRVLKTLGQQQGKAQRPDQVYINALLTEYGNRSGTIKGRAKASLQAEAQARAKASGSE